MRASIRRKPAGGAGFSLVELAIVIVIIGLILSSVLVGQDIIRAAELRAVTSDMNNYKTAVQAFAARFGNRMPGDIKNPAQFALAGGNNCPTAGDGDGLIEDSAGGKALHTGEVSCFWYDLGEVQLISGTYDGYNSTPGATVNAVIGKNVPQVRGKATGWGVFTDGLDNFLVAGADAANATNAYTTKATFSPNDGLSIDEKVDDGNPLSGSVMARDAAASDPNSTAGAAASTCYDNGNDTDASNDKYKIPNETPQCVLIFKLPQI